MLLSVALIPFLNCETTGSQQCRAACGGQGYQYQPSNRCRPEFCHCDNQPKGKDK